MKPQLTRLDASQLAQVLSVAGAGDVTPKTISTCVDRGAPQNEDGTFNLIAYTAWLAKQHHGR